MPSSRRERPLLADVRRGVEARRLLAEPLGALARGQVDVGPDRRHQVGLVDDDDGSASNSLVARDRHATRSDPSRVDDDAPRRSRSSSGQDRAAGVRPSAREVEHDVAGEGVDLLEPLGRGPRVAPARQAEWSWSASTRHRAARQPELGGLVVGHHQQLVGAVGVARTCSAWYSTPGRRPPTDARARSGRAASSTHTSLVSRLSDQITDQLAAAGGPHLSSNCSSGSSSTSTSSATGVPSRCRQTWCGRYSSSCTV